MIEKILNVTAMIEVAWIFWFFVYRKLNDPYFP